MCMIIDTNVASNIFEDAIERTEAADFLRSRLDDGKINLVVSNALLEELSRVPSFRIWWDDMLLTGKIDELTESEIMRIESETRKLMREDTLDSNDHHIIALAKVTGAGVLCTEDKKLIKDYKNLKIGKVYPLNSKVSKTYRGILDYGECARKTQQG